MPTCRSYSLDYRYGKQRAWGALGYGASSLIGGVVYDAGTGGYAGVMVVFVVATVAAFVVATGVRIGTNVEGADDPKSPGQRCVFSLYLFAVSVRVLVMSDLWEF